MRALAFACTLHSSPTPSSSHVIAGQVMAEFESLGVGGEVVRVADHDIRPGVGLEAVQGTDYKDLDGPPEAVASTTRTLAVNAAHLARLLTGSPYPAT
ncbi:hypothetical protein ACIBCU_23270 [Streptomyces sp. NPDC051064]|uniref:hypothetical protein n=1 Tax=Streptomyces sp. NPDC051064 TaxID=3365641 RepID=UPI0037BC5DD1